MWQLKRQPPTSERGNATHNNEYDILLIAVLFLWMGYKANCWMKHTEKSIGVENIDEDQGEVKETRNVYEA